MRESFERDITVCVVHDWSRWQEWPRGAYIEDENGNEIDGGIDIFEFDGIKPEVIDVDDRISYATYKLTALLQGNYTPATPGTGPSYSQGGDPGSRPEWDTTSFEVYGMSKDLADKLYAHFSEKLIGEIFK
jgi:hypothetical protein